MCEIPSLIRRWIDSSVISFSFKYTWPPLTFSNPVMPNTTSFWPFPSIPAIQTISPLLTSKEISSTIFTPLWILSSITKLRTFKMVSVGFDSFLSMVNITSRPTMSLDNSSLVVFLTSNVFTNSPLLKTEQTSATSIISSSLWEMKRIDLPSLARFFIIWRSSLISCGVKTAVGSSKISTSLSR